MTEHNQSDGGRWRPDPDRFTVQPGEIVVVWSPPGDWDGAVEKVDQALAAVDALGKVEWNRPGDRHDRQRVSEILNGVRYALLGAAGAMREAHGASVAADKAQRAAIDGR